MHNIFFTADLHAGHANIIKYCSRPFVNAYEMNETIIRNWNNVVSDHDFVYILGDFVFKGSPGYTNELMSRLKGKKILIAGNHDDSRTLRAGWHEVYGSSDCAAAKTVKIDKEIIICSHYRHIVWNRSCHGSWHLFGHSHSTLTESVLVGDPISDELRKIPALSFDVGVDAWDFTPIDFDMVRKKMKFKKENPDYFWGPKYQLAIKNKGILIANKELNKMIIEL